MKMTQEFNIPKSLQYLSLLLILIGLVALTHGFMNNPDQTWAAILLNNFYFLSLSLGGLFFIAIQYVTESGWAVMFKRIPEAMHTYLIAAGIIMLLFYFGIKNIYHWADPEIVAKDPLIAYKTPYLNTPFFIARVVFLFICWIIIARVIRHFSISEDKAGGILYFNKSKHYSMVFIFLFVVTFSVAAFDWIMSIDAHWYSTIFGLRAIISSVYYAVAAIILILLYLNKKGLYPELNKYHRHDFARYLFRFSIIWGYLWFMQYIIIWYANIPEDTAYYAIRKQPGWKLFYYADLLINWFVPFMLLMSDKLGKNRLVLIFTSILLLIGFYISLYLQIIPGSIGVRSIGFIEIGSFAGFLGLFIILFFLTFKKVPVVPKNHPYIGESLQHHL